MKKPILPILAALCMIGLTACGTAESAGSSAAEHSAAQTETVQETDPQTESGDAEQTEAAPESVPQTDADAQTAEVSAAGETPADTGNAAVVVYFSATGTTKGVAERIAAVTGADIFEIVPAEPYTDADLDWHDNNSRTTIEMNDPNVRPAMADDTVRLEDYATVYLGYPIWWGDAPRIMSTFAEAHDFSGKTVIPFCTSGGSPIGQSGKNLAALAGSGSWLAGGRLEAGISESEIQDWISSMN